MDLTLLAEFEAVVAEGGFRAAAATLGRSPSSLSSHVRALEAEVGAQLLERTTKRVKLTPAGRALLEETRGSIAQLKRATELVRRIDRGQAERIRIGHSDSAAVELLQRSVAGLLDRYPGLYFSVQQLPSAELVAHLAGDQLDLALLRPPLNHPDLEEQHLFDEPIVALVPAGHRLAGQGSVHLADLIDSPLIVPPRTLAPTTHDTVLDACRTITGAAPPAGQEAADSISFLVLLAAGAGVALLPRYTTRHLKLAGVTILPVAEALPPLPLHLAWRRDNASPLVAELRNHLQVAAGRLRTTGRRRAR